MSALDREQALAGEEELQALGQAAVAEMTELMPDNHPYLAGFFFGDQGTIWVMHAEGDADGSQERTIGVLRPDGAFVGNTRAALASQPQPRMRNGLLVGVVRDELGIESIARYQLEWERAGR